jgi:succinate dehydrogenase / fumarate reductase, cytochrome b subunit
MKRPLSPHLQIYKPQITSVLSILHRISGIGIFFLNAFFLCLWIGCFYKGTDCFLVYQQSLFIKFLFVAWVYGIYYHMFNGVRHLFWDMKKGMELDSITKSGWFVVGLAFVFGTLTWLMAFGFFK